MIFADVLRWFWGRDFDPGEPLLFTRLMGFDPPHRLSVLEGDMSINVGGGSATPILEKLRPSQIRSICKIYASDQTATISAIAARVGLTRWITQRAIGALLAAGQITGGRATMRSRVVEIVAAAPNMPRAAIGERLGTSRAGATNIVYDLRRSGRLPAYDRDQTQCARVLRLVRADPGIRAARIAERLGLPYNVASSTVSFLRRRGLVLPRDADQPGAWPMVTALEAA